MAENKSTGSGYGSNLRFDGGEKTTAGTGKNRKTPGNRNHAFENQSWQPAEGSAKPESVQTHPQTDSHVHTQSYASLKTETTASGSWKSRLVFSEEEIPAGKGAKRPASSKKKFQNKLKSAPITATAGVIRQQASSQEAEDSYGNQGIEAASFGADAAAGIAAGASYVSEARKKEKNRQKLQDSKYGSKLEEGASEKYESDSPYAKRQTRGTHSDADASESSNRLSKRKQKQRLQEEYRARQRSQEAASTASSAGGSLLDGIRSKFEGIGDSLKEFSENAVEYVASHPIKAVIFGLLLLLTVAVAGGLVSCSAVLPGLTDSVIATSYTAEDSDIIGANDDYETLEANLQNRIDCIETTNPGYDEYNYDVDQIGHDPYQLASYLTVLFENYTRSQVQSQLQEIFDQQYTLTLTPVTETRTRTVTRTGTRLGTNADTGLPEIQEYEYEEEEEYEYKILNVTLRNNGLAMVVGNSGLTDDQLERYAILNETKGNKPDLFQNDAFVVSSTANLTYDIPGEALTDEKFARMMNEAEKYLGYPYVWGGSSPSTSFDCSGFVSYVINHCGNGWNVGRQTANGLKNLCSIIPQSSAKPGDLIFFQGTYDTSGASHVGIIVDPVNKVMIHCGNPIQFTSYDTNYWRQHFYCVGRIP